MENEVRQLELEQEKIIQTKEKEMLEHLLKQGRHSGGKLSIQLFGFSCHIYSTAK